MIKVNTLGLIFAAMRLQSAANSLTTLTNAAFAQPLAADGTSAGAAARLDAASTALMASTAAHIASLNEAALHLIRKFGDARLDHRMVIFVIFVHVRSPSRRPSDRRVSM